MTEYLQYVVNNKHEQAFAMKATEDTAKYPVCYNKESLDVLFSAMTSIEEYSSARNSLEGECFNVKEGADIFLVKKGFLNSKFMLKTGDSSAYVYAAKEIESTLK